jgi:hypothetical protein
MLDPYGHPEAGLQMMERNMGADLVPAEKVQVIPIS